MRNLIIIEDHYLIRLQIIGCLGAIYFNEEDRTHNEEWCLKMMQRIEGAGFNVEEFYSNKQVVTKYPDRLPQETVIILDGDLSDGSSEKIFNLFSEKAKELTLVHTASWNFPEQASKAGFSNFLSKNIGEDYRRKLGETILKMCKS